MDWDAGHYERVAKQLEPAAGAVVDRAAPRAGERALDVGCGTGNGALLAAARGAVATGVDPAPRLLEVARARAQDQGLAATFAEGDAAALPVADASVELVLSVFGVIFAPDPGVAAAELARVTAPGGRLVLSAWFPEGALFEAMRIRREAMSGPGEPGTVPWFGWHDRDDVGRLLEPHGFSIAMHERSIAFTAASPERFVEAELRDHPAWIEAVATLRARGGDPQALRDRLLEHHTTANELPGGFRVTSRYVVIEATRA